MHILHSHTTAGPMTLGHTFGDLTEVVCLLGVVARVYSHAGRQAEADAIIDRADSIRDLRDRWELADIFEGRRI